MGAGWRRNMAADHFEELADEPILSPVRHADLAAGEVGVEVLALAEVDAGGRVTVAVQQMVDVVLSAVTGEVIRDRSVDLITKII